ncbi:MAG TPA: YggS family pyridoxal phosphate-dependent enzyme [Clostridiales bacterium]|nr:YggS family pyridoxal phosphate-dependent enzyme [Clostridiales bacterium]
MQTAQAGAIKDRLDAVMHRIARAAEKSGRDPREITLIGVTKTQTPDTVENAIRAGILDLGENRVQELCQKHALFGADLHSLPGTSLENSLFDPQRQIHLPRWHLIGHLQTNKVKQAVGKVRLIHSADSSELMQEIDKRSRSLEITTDILIQVNVSGELTKSGIHPRDVRTLIRKGEEFNNIRIRGLMTIAPLSQDMELIRDIFRKMNQIFIDIKQEKFDNTYMEYLSMGMSGDFETAIEEGANLVRIGSAVFGPR